MHGHFIAVGIIKIVNTHCIGSKCDGYNSNDSDVDLMFVLNKCVVDASHEERNTSSCLLAVTSPRSSYVQIHVGELFASADIPLDSTLINYNHRMLLSSYLFKLKYYANILADGSEDIAGPSYVDNFAAYSNDNVLAFRCESWPKIANEWTHRRRKYSWPKPTLVTFITSKGCHYVPVGEYNSPYYHLEWRLSFVLSECVLVRSFNHVQFKVYCLLKLLKMLLQSAYKHPISQESLITSYHMKTIIFFCIENSPMSFWSNGNIVLCFRMCLVYLRNAVASNYLPHYILPQCNLFKKLSETYQEQTNIHAELNISDPLILINVLLKKHDQYCNIYVDTFFNESQNIKNMNVYSLILAQTTNEWHVCIHSMLDNIHSFSDFEYILVTKMTLDNIYKNNHYSERGIHGNKTSWITKRRAKYVFLRRSHYDVAVGWLQLSNFYYVTKQYYKAEHICRKVITSISSEVFYVGYCGGIHPLMQTLSNHEMNIQQGIKRFTANYVSLSVNSLYPNEMDIEVVNYALPVMSILPLLYAYFVLFLCAYHRCDVATQCDILGTLESLIYDNNYGLRVHDGSTFIILNMVGICYEL